MHNIGQMHIGFGCFHMSDFTASCFLFFVIEVVKRWGSSDGLDGEMSGELFGLGLFEWLHLSLLLFFELGDNDNQNIIGPVHQQNILFFVIVFPKE